METRAVIRRMDTPDDGLFSHPDLSPFGESPSVPGSHRVNPLGFSVSPEGLADFHRRSGITPCPEEVSLA